MTSASKKAAGDLGTCLKSSGVSFDKGYGDKFKKLVISNGLGADLQNARKYVAGLPPMTPAGIAVGIRKIDEVKTMIANNNNGIMFSGALSQLRLEEGALSTVDYGRIGYIIESAATDLHLQQLIGVIIVNLHDGFDTDLKRANKDAEVDALCLLMYWVSHDKQASDRLVQLASDLVFEGRDLGTGSEVFGAKFELMTSEERSRHAMAVSGWRKCIFLADYLERVTAEGRIADAKTPGEKLPM